MSDQWNATLYDRAHGFVHQLGQGLVDLLSPKPGERILDLGCGTGPLTQKIADCGAEVLGIDASPAMVAQARRNYPTIRFEVADATLMSFDQPFDAIFSNAVLHWVKPPEQAAARMHQAIKPGGRLVLEMGGKGNVSKILGAAVRAGNDLGLDLQSVVDTNYFPSIGEYSTVLEQAGFAVSFAALFDRPTALSDGELGLRNWIRMFRPGLEEVVPVDRLEEFYQIVEQRCRIDLFRDGIWYADYRRLRLTATRV